MTSWMIATNDPARGEIVARAKRLKIASIPDKASHTLGEVILADGRKVNAYVVHAMDAIITDGQDVVMINRSHDPGKGKPALPGGFMDPTANGTAESPVATAMREAMEEAGIDLTHAKPTLVGNRNMNRPFDVRVAINDSLLENYGIKQGDVFMVSTQAVRFDVPDLKNTNLVAGDDALPGSARRVPIKSLTKETVGIPDHYDMVMAALSPHSRGANTKFGTAPRAR